MVYGKNKFYFTFSDQKVVRNSNLEFILITMIKTKILGNDSVLRNDWEDQIEPSKLNKHHKMKLVWNS